MIDLDTYLRRIGHDGPREPTLATLAAICSAHPAQIAFENIDPLLGRAPTLAPAALQAKLVAQRRGGYCYEQNALLRLALLALGFRVTALAARVLWMGAPDAPVRPRSHMLLQVELPQGAQEPLIVDAGFGGHLFDLPLRLQPGVVQPTAAGARLRVTQAAEAFAVETELPDGWAALYRFTLEAHLPVDYEPLNWFTATHPASIFRHNLLIERLRPQARASLRNDLLTVRVAGAAPQLRRIESADALARVLDEVFDLQPPVPAAELFDRIPKRLDGMFMPSAL